MEKRCGGLLSVVILLMENFNSITAITSRCAAGFSNAIGSHRGWLIFAAATEAQATEIRSPLFKKLI
jgi:hypothetical protein